MDLHTATPGKINPQVLVGLGGREGCEAWGGGGVECHLSAEAGEEARHLPAAAPAHSSHALQWPEGGSLPLPSPHSLGQHNLLKRIF